MKASALLLLIPALAACAWAQPQPQARAQASAATWPEQAVPSTSQKAAVLEDKRINESSGLCRSGTHSGVFWTHNDSGGEPCIFAIDTAGKTRAKVRVRHAANFDWEDIALGKDAAGAPALFIGDIGDNFFIRPTVQVYQIPEPAIRPLGKAVDETESEAPHIWRANYPDGKHNAESLLVHPVTGRLYILTKSENGKCALYGFPQPLQENTSMTLEKVASLTFPLLTRAGKRPHDNCMTTAAGFSPDGSHLLAATYSSLYEWELPSGMALGEALKRAPERIEPQMVRQMEGACYDQDGKTIWFTSELLPTPLMKVARP